MSKVGILMGSKSDFEVVKPAVSVPKIPSTAIYFSSVGLKAILAELRRPH